MQPVLNLYKPISVTPLQLITQLQKTYPEYKNVKLAYAGRLDPMAEGVLLVLVGEECKKRESYELLKKEYEFDVLFGISTDTYDVMGMITKFSIFNFKFEKTKIPILSDLGRCAARQLAGSTPTGAKNSVSSILNSRYKHPQGVLKNELTQFVGKYSQSYPPYSSARVNGKPLYYWARENRLDEIQIPQKEIEVYDLKYLGEKYISTEDLLQTITDRITKVEGKFRQTEILENWNDILKKDSTFNVPLSTFSISCSSGTYVRSIANEIGKKLGVPSLTYSIKRTKVGDFRIEDSVKI